MKYSKLLAVTLLAVPLAARAEDPDRGEQLYWMHCASCHGLEAEGDGPMRPALLVAPANLRTLTAENGGIFPTQRVVRRIDGTDPQVNMGSPMPIYGPFFAVDDTPMKTETGQPIMTSSPVVDIVAYLKTLQTGD